MGQSKTPTIEQFPYRNTDQEPGVNRYASLPTVQEMKSGPLFGIPLKSALTGETLQDEVIQSYMDAAISELEHTLDMYIKPVEFEEQHDYNKEMFQNAYAYVKLNHSNVLDVSEVKLSFSNSPQEQHLIQFPNEFVYVMGQEGAVQLVPAFGQSFSGFLLSAFSGFQFHALRTMGINMFPGGVHIKYRCGFEDSKVPALLTNLIKDMAARSILQFLGPILFPHNGVSISIDGVSQSTSTQGPQFLALRLQQLEQQINRQLDTAKGYYQRKFLVDYV